MDMLFLGKTDYSKNQMDLNRSTSGTIVYHGVSSIPSSEPIHVPPHLLQISAPDHIQLYGKSPQLQRTPSPSIMPLPWAARGQWPANTETLSLTVPTCANAEIPFQRQSSLKNQLHSPREQLFPLPTCLLYFLTDLAPWNHSPRTTSLLHSTHHFSLFLGNSIKNTRIKGKMSYSWGPQRSYEDYWKWRKGVSLRIKDFWALTSILMAQRTIFQSFTLAPGNSLHAAYVLCREATPGTSPNHSFNGPAPCSLHCRYNPSMNPWVCGMKFLTTMVQGDYIRK